MQRGVENRVATVGFDLWWSGAGGWQGWIPLDGPTPWTLVREAPLTVQPSIRLGDLFHGYVTGGRWVPC